MMNIRISVCLKAVKAVPLYLHATTIRMAPGSSIKAVICRNLGDPTKTAGGPLSLTHNYPRVPEVLPQDHVRIRVIAASVNFADALQIQGQYQDKKKVPFVPGSEVSGEAIEVGTSVTKVKKGDTVVAIATSGAFAEEICVNYRAVYRIPPEIDPISAAGLPVAFGTAHLALKDRANLQAEQTVLILGAAGGVGIAAVQIAKVLGARVVALARGQVKTDALKDLGADVVIDTAAHKDRPLRQAIREAAKEGVDVVFDPVGGTQLQEALKCVKWGAHVLFIGFASGSIPKIAANIALVKNLTLHGIFWGSYMKHNPKTIDQGIRELILWLADKRITVPISHRYHFEEVSEAFRVLMARQVVGKVVLLPSAPHPASPVPIPKL